MQKIKREYSVFKFSPQNKPAAHALSGETIIFETFDCYSNTIVEDNQDLPITGRGFGNPATGPLFIDGAMPGDILKVEIFTIELDSQGAMRVIPGSGAFGHLIKEHRTKILPITDGKIKFNNWLELDVNPMIGVIGTAPKKEEIPTCTPSSHGGNMDCKLIGEGSTLYLPVNVPGALLAMGDVHALMGDGEVVICGVEIAAKIIVKIDVLSNLSLPLPIVVSKDHLATIASEETLDQAALTASEMMLSFIQQALEMDIPEAGMLLSIAADLRICQIVDPLMTARMEFPLWILEKYGYQLP